MGGMINFFKRKSAGDLAKLPSGTFSLDREGKIISSTLPADFPEAQMRDIGGRVLQFFRGAQDAKISLQELTVYYPNLKVTARNLRGGALIFLIPQAVPKN